MGTRLFCTLAGAVLFIGACSTPTPTPTPTPSAASASAGTSQPSKPFSLAGTGWQLISIRDGQGTKTFGHPSPYAVTFGADGQAQFKLDCNTGNATWEAKPNPPDPSVNFEAWGGLKFGPISSTKMLCAQRLVDERVKKDLSLVLSYILKDQEDGKLHMDLPNEGSLGWDPA